VGLAIAIKDSSGALNRNRCIRSFTQIPVAPGLHAQDAKPAFLAVEGDPFYQSGEDLGRAVRPSTHHRSDHPPDRFVADLK